MEDDFMQMNPRRAALDFRLTFFFSDLFWKLFNKKTFMNESQQIIAAHSVVTIESKGKVTNVSFLLVVIRFRVSLSI